MAEQTTFYFAGNAGTLHPINARAIDATRKLRDAAIDLKDRAASGGYENPDVAAFWKLVENAPSILFIRPDELSKRAGLGANYFASMVKEKRYPKLHNFLKAISAVIAVADNRLAEVEPSSQLVRVGWIANPLATDTYRAEALQNRLVDLVRELKSSNALSDIPELDAYWRKTLISLLETTIQVLRAPLAEPSLFQRTVTGLRGFAKEAAKTASKQFVGGLAEKAAKELSELWTKAG